MSVAEITVRIRYLSAVREQTGKRADELRLPSESTLASISQWLLETYSISVPGPDLMSTLNGRGWAQAPGGLSTQLHEGDEIALFPLLSGG
jgi:molybdopterin converting factor small subunit